MIVIKFGGTSIGSAERIRNLYEIALQQQENETLVIVVSAIAGTTNLLTENPQEVISIHNQILKDLELDPNLLDQYYSGLDSAAETPEQMDKLLSYGELMSSTIVSEYFKSRGTDNTRLTGWEAGIVTDSNFNSAEILPETFDNIPNNFQEGIYIVTGFIAKDVDGRITTLGRGGSDYTATILASGLNAREIQIWTDVSGMRSTDPSLVENALQLERISYEEAGELAYFGARVLHPKTIQPAQDKNIPIRILNSLERENPGTTINGSAEAKNGVVRAIAFKEGITTIRICSSRMLGAQGFLARIFEVFASHEISIDMVTTSEVTVSVTVDNPKNIDKAVTDLEEFSRVNVNNERALLCIVGKGMYKNAFIPGKVLSCLASNDISVEMVSQGASSINISCIVRGEDVKEAVRALHNEFFPVVAQ